MTVECMGEYWIAHGKGPARAIVCEGNTRREAWYAYAETYRDQLSEVETYGC